MAKKPKWRESLTDELREGIGSVLGYSPKRAVELIQGLTPRERDVIVLLAKGEKNWVIGETLEISPKTVDIHRTNIKNKLQIKSTSEIVRLVYASLFND